MNATELRLGNWVLDSDRENPYLHQVVRIETKEYTEWDSGCDYNVIVRIEGSEDGYFEMRPSGIPLTEEWLLRFGFKETKNNKDSGYKEHELWFKGFTILFSTECNSFSDCFLESIGIDIEYVHQLQNLYFALTGEELELKPESK